MGTGGEGESFDYGAIIHDIDGAFRFTSFPFFPSAPPSFSDCSVFRSVSRVFPFTVPRSALLSSLALLPFFLSLPFTEVLPSLRRARQSEAPPNDQPRRPSLQPPYVLAPGTSLCDSHTWRGKRFRMSARKVDVSLSRNSAGGKRAAPSSPLCRDSMVG